jgi:hypothetical protein
MIGAKPTPSTRPRTASCSARRWTRSAWKAPSARIARPHGKSIEAREALRRSSACPRSSARPSPWAAPAAASPTTARNSRRSSSAASTPRRPRGAGRGERARLEGIRDGGRPRQGGQLHHHLLDRERRPDGRAHRRLDHRRPGADADRQGIPDHAQRLDRVLREIGVETGGSNVQFAVNPPTAAWSSSR